MDEDLEGMTGAGRGFSSSEYIEGIVEGWPEEDIARWIVCGLPRDFHALSAAEQREALAERVPLTHTKWDALLAAMVEHVARLNGHEPPGWVDEPERFLPKRPGPRDEDAAKAGIIGVRIAPARRAPPPPASSGRRRPEFPSRPPRHAAPQARPQRAQLLDRTSAP